MIDQEIITSIKENIVKIYGVNNIKTAYITGSIPAGKSRPDSDIDIFFCYSDSIDKPDSKKKLFTKFYFDLHSRLKRTPDDISPGEPLSYSELYDAIELIQNVEPNEELIDRNHFDAICWVGMLISKKIMLIDHDQDIINLIEKARIIANKWVSKLSPEVEATENTGEYTDLDKILRKKISCPGYYDAH